MMRLLTVALAAGAAFVLLGVAATALYKPNGLEYSELHGSLPQEYETIPELSSAADLVIVGRVTAFTTLHENPRPQIAVLRTVYQVEVREVIRGVVDDSTVSVTQTGGKDGRMTQEVSDDPLFSLEGEYVLFLKYSPETQRYYTTGGHQGRLVVEGGQVSSLSTQYPSRNIDDLAIHGMTLDDVRALSR